MCVAALGWAITGALTARGARADVIEGFRALEKGDYDLAAINWFPLAQQGEPLAQFGLALMYENGQGFARDMAQAARWYAGAARAGLPEAQFNLGRLLFTGAGVEQNLDEAAFLFLEAAKRNHPQAQVQIGVMLSAGAGVRPNLIEAYKWTFVALGRFAPGGNHDANAQNKASPR